MYALTSESGNAWTASVPNVAAEILALAAGIRHNHLTGQPGRAFAAYGR